MSIFENSILCVDLGGTHCSGALIEQEKECIISGTYHRDHVHSDAGKEQIFSEIESVIHQVIGARKEHIQRVLISCPGPFDYQNGISLMDGMNKYQSLLHVNLKEFFAKITGVSTHNIKFFNDAAAFLLGEVFYQKIKNKRVVGLTLGTGLGSALYEQGKIQDLNYGSATFKNGIAEDMISTRGILAHLRQHFEDIAFDNIKALVEDPSLVMHKKEAFDFLSKQLIDFLNQYVVPLAPDSVIIGGSIAKAHLHFFERVCDAVPLNLQVASFDENNLFLGLTLETS